MLFDAQVEGRTIRVEVRNKNQRYEVSLDGRLLEVDLQETGRDFVSLLIEGRSYEVGLQKTASGYTVVTPGDTVHVELLDSTRGKGPLKKMVEGRLDVVAPMPGKLIRVLVEVGQEVEPGQGLVVVEAMKMENELTCPRPGKVLDLRVREGQAVEAGAVLLVVESKGAP